MASPTHPYPECAAHPSESDVTAAKGAFQAGTVSFNEADYDRAILYWEDAYRRDCTATLLLNHLSRAYEGLGNREQAVIALRTYLDRSPDSPERAQIQRRIEVFEQKIAEEKQQAAAAQPPKPTPTQPTLGVPADQPNNAAQPASPPPVTSEGKPFPWGPVAVIAAGGVATVVGGVVYLKARSDISNVENYKDPKTGLQPCKNHVSAGNLSCPAALAQQGNDARSRATVGTVVTISGVAIAGAGVVWLLLDSKKSPQTAEYREAPAVSPWVGVGSAGVSWQGSF
jgi:tetratricopeptide (TPR) repeat protein